MLSQSVYACYVMACSKHGSVRSVVQYPTCLDLLEEKKIDCEPLITHRFGFSQDEVITGFETAAAAGKTGAIKVMFNW